MQVNTFLASNLDYLCQKAAPVAQWLAASNPPSPGYIASRIFQNRHGMMDWRMDNGLGVLETIPLPAVYGDWIPADKLESSATVIAGAGLGYGLAHVLRETPSTHRVLVVEPRPEMLLACLGQTDFVPFFEIGKLTFVPPDENAIAEAVKFLDVAFLFGQIHLRVDISLKQLGPEYDRWARITREKLENFSVELATLRLKQEVMVKNELNNFNRAMNDGSLKPMQGMGAGLTAVILGAGPSLEQNAPALAEHRGKAIFVSALQTLPALERLGIKPDFCLAIDFRESMVKAMEGLTDKDFPKDIPLIYSTKMNPAVLSLYPGPTIPLWTMGGLATFVLQDHELVLDAGGNVGVTLARFLTWCGVTRFILAGQDFAWSGNFSHAKGHHFGDGGYVFDPARDVSMTNLYGQTIYSNLGYLSAKRDLESDIKKNPDVAFYNFYGGGAVVEGAENLGLGAITERGLLSDGSGARERFLHALARVRGPRLRPVFQARGAMWSSSLNNVGKKLEKLFKKPGRNATAIRSTLAEIQFFLKQDPLYLPYLYNEVMDIACLVQAKLHYGPADMVKFRAVAKRIMTKIREMDATLCSPSGVKAA